MKNRNKLRVAIIGLGAVSRNIHLPAYGMLQSKITIVGGCDPESEARKNAPAKFGIKDTFEDALEMIKATAPDVISICTPPSLHVEQSLMALENKCHVFCEKPLAENLDQARILCRASKEADRLIVINSQFPYMNIHRKAKEMIGSPEFGKLLFLQAWQTMRPAKEEGWRHELTNRICFEFGVHVFELMRYFFEAEPVRISAQMPNPVSGRQSDSLNLISAEFADGRAASIILNRLSQGAETYLDMRLDGEHASINTSIGGRIAVEAGIHTREKIPFIDVNFIKGGRAVWQKKNKSKVIAKDGINPFASATAYHFNNFIKAINEGGIPPGEINDNVKTLRLAFAAYDSAKSRCAVDLANYS